MKDRKNVIKIWFIMLGMIFIGMVCPKMVAFAGGINGNEARVIAAASGTFTYEGRTYRAQSSYINTLNVYLCRDNVDLTAEQASEAISRMYGSVAEGVAQGYLYEVGGSTEDRTTEDGTTEDRTTEDGTTEAGSTEAGTTEDASTEDASAGNGAVDVDEWLSSSDGNIWEVMDNPTEAKTTLQQRPKEESASVLVELDQDDVVVSTKDNKKVILSKKKNMIPSGVILGIQIASAVVLLVTVVGIVFLLAGKCMVFRVKNRKRRNHGHSRRKVIRHRVRAVLTVTTTISILGVFLLAGLKAGLFNRDVIMRNMQSSGYFRYAYSEYLADMVDDATEKDIQTSEMKTIQTYEDYLFAIKQNTMKILDGKKETPIPDSNVAPYVANLERSYMSVVKLAGGALLLSGILGMIFMYFMDQQRERGMKHMAASFLIAGFILMIGVMVLLVAKPYAYMYIEPDYLYLFLVSCIKQFTSVMTAMTAFMVVMGMILFGLFLNLKNRRSE